MLFDVTVEGLTAATYYSGLRHKVIANNIANLSTPNYKAMDIVFKDQIKTFMKSKSENRFSSVHYLPPPKTILSPYQSDQRPNIELNTVDIDQEQVKLAQNTILHNTFLQLLSSKFRILRASISGNV